MMKKAITILLAVFALGLKGLLIAGDPIQVEPFHSIIVSGEILSEIIPSETESIELDFKNADENNLIVEVVDSVLKLRMKTGNYKDAKLKLKIYYINPLDYLEAYGRAQIWSAGNIETMKDLTVKLDNGGEMRFGLNCDSLNATLSKGSVIHLIGNCRALRVKVSTNATFSGYEFSTETADVFAGSTGKAKISVSNYLNANASSKGFIGYVGDPDKVDKKISLKGEILKTELE